MVSNKYKQLYECRLPAQAVRFHQDPASEPDSQGYTGPDIPELLSPMHDAQCLVKVGCFAASRLSDWNESVMHLIWIPVQQNTHCYWKYKPLTSNWFGGCFFFFRQRTGGHMNSAMDSTSGSTTLKVRTQYFLFSNEMKFLHCVPPSSLNSDSEIKGDVLFLGYYESEFDWSNETAKVKQCLV